MPAAQAQRKQIPVAQLLLDVENPRLASGADSQSDALRQVAIRDEQALLKLAEDIVNNGLDPLAALAVITLEPDGSQYVALEGNRRLSALISLENPARVSAHLTTKGLKRLEALSARYAETAPVAVDCAVFRDRTSANHWIALRHTGQNEGVGTVPWGTDEQDRFRSAANGTRSMAGQVVDFLRARGIETASEGSTTADYLTTLDRLLSSPKVRSVLGVTLKNKRLLLTHAQDSVVRALDHLVQQLRTRKLKVDRLMTRAQREDWADKVPARVRVADRAKLPAPVPIDEITVQPPRAQVRAVRAQPEPDPFARTTLAPKSLKLNFGSNTRPQMLFGELKKVNVDEYPNLVSVGFRVFLEFSLDVYLERPDAPRLKTDATLKQKLLAVAQQLRDTAGLSLQEFRVVKKAAEDNKSINASTYTFNQYVHNVKWHPDPRLLKVMWTELEGFIKALWP